MACVGNPHYVGRTAGDDPFGGVLAGGCALTHELEPRAHHLLTSAPVPDMVAHRADAERIGCARRVAPIGSTLARRCQELVFFPSAITPLGVLWCRR